MQMEDADMFPSLILAIASVLLILPAAASGADVAADAAARRTFVLDGSAAHDVGNTHLNITNWGLIGSRPGVGAPYSTAPSLDLDGVDHLWGAGLWVGGIVDGVASVSTGQYTAELLADPDDPLDVIYESGPGHPMGKRYPMPNADDDLDGLEDEDPLDGRDNDGDGRIDEDYAGVGRQYFHARMRDDTALSQALFPDHSPMGIEVMQESFQWKGRHIDDFVGFRFTITNHGDSMIEDPYVGMFADFDIGSAENDLAGFHRGATTAYDGSLVDLTLGYAYSADSEGAYAGVVLAGPGFDTTSFQVYSGNEPFDRGGDPTNDAERYQSLSADEFDAAGGTPNDYRILIAAGPFADLAPGESVVVDLAFVVGATEDELIRNAANAVRLANGEFFDRDGDLSTGAGGKEFHVAWYEGKGQKKGHARGRMHLKAIRSPSNPRIELQYELPVRAATRIDVFDTRGRRVATILDQVMDAGPGQLVWDGSDFRNRSVSSGVYFVRLQQEQLTATTRAVVVR
jgi:hypothetical protein